MICENKILYFKDGQYYHGQKYPDIYACADLYKDILFWTDMGDFQFRFTGILVCNDCPVIVFPKDFPLPENYDGKMEAARLLMRVILRYRKESALHAVEQPLLGSFKKESIRIVTAVSLLNLFVENGLLEHQISKTGMHEKGLTLWPQTMVKVQPLISCHNVAYIRQIRRIQETDIQHLITRIHGYVIYQCARLWGWLLNQKIVLPSDYSKLPCSVKEAISLLKMELRETFYQKKRYTISLLIAYLENDGDRTIQQRILAGTNNYEYVWESILGYVFCNRYGNIREIFPQPKWIGIPWNISQRPDIVSVYGDTLCVLDAKYRSITHDSIGWYDAAKQFIYGYTARCMLQKYRYHRLLAGVKRVCNVFAFPGSGKMMEYKGKLVFPGFPALGTVYAFTIGQTQAMEFYAYRNEFSESNDYITFLLRHIEKDITMC